MNNTKNPAEIRQDFFGGRRWIRTTEVVDNRFTVCPLWPLGNSPIFNFIRKAYCLNSRLLGAGGRTRTPDLLITNQLLYQLSYTSEFRFILLSSFVCSLDCLYIIPQGYIFVNTFFKKFKIYFINYKNLDFCWFLRISKHIHNQALIWKL